MRFFDGIAWHTRVRFRNRAPADRRPVRRAGRRAVTVTTVTQVVRCFRPFPWQGTSGPIPEVDIAAGAAPVQLRSPRPSLGGRRRRQHDFAPSRPGGLLQGGEQGIDFRFGRPGVESPVEALNRDREDPGDRLSVLGVAQGGVAEPGTDRGKPGVAGAGAVAAVVFKMVEEVADERGIQVGDVESARAVSRCGPRRTPGAAARRRGRRRRSGRWRAAAGPAGR